MASSAGGLADEGAGLAAGRLTGCIGRLVGCASGFVVAAGRLAIERLGLLDSAAGFGSGCSRIR